MVSANTFEENVSMKNMKDLHVEKKKHFFFQNLTTTRNSVPRIKQLITQINTNQFFPKKEKEKNKNRP